MQRITALHLIDPNTTPGQGTVTYSLFKLLPAEGFVLIPVLEYTLHSVGVHIIVNDG